MLHEFESKHLHSFSFKQMGWLAMSMTSITSKAKNDLVFYNLVPHLQYSSVSQSDWIGGDSYYSSLEEGTFASLTIHSHH